MVIFAKVKMGPGFRRDDGGLGKEQIPRLPREIPAFAGMTKSRANLTP
jgi:hypothetical protein